MNAWYDRIVSPPQQQMPQQQFPQMQFQNPMQKMSFLMQAMSNPAAFVKQQIPDIPDNIVNNPNQILSYLQKTRGITNQQIQQLAQQNPYPFPGNGGIPNGGTY